MAVAPGAIERLESETYGMVIIGVYFDESRTFDLLHHVRLSRRDRTVPVACVLEAEGALRMSSWKVSTIRRSR
jgi:hypothetical protein